LNPHGLGRRLLEQVFETAAGRAVTVAAETVPPDAEALYARFGLIEIFRELVLRHPLTAVPAVPVPAGVRLVPVAQADPGDLFAAYVGAFAGRPGFPDPGPGEWLGELEGDRTWRRDVSAVAYHDNAPVGFVNVLGDSIDQVGVLPSWRRRGLGAHLVSRALVALAADDGRAAWLTVSVDNAAADLYAALGFAVAGSRARFVRPGSQRSVGTAD
jgi:ribosomal protein S18 acetylase RimI-like enzyme